MGCRSLSTIAEEEGCSPHLAEADLKEEEFTGWAVEAIEVVVVSRPDLPMPLQQPGLREV